MASYEETLEMIRKKKKKNTSSNISSTRANVYNSLGISMPTRNQRVVQNNTQKQTNEKRTWLNSGAFSDGYQFGDVARTIGSTLSDVGSNLVKGVLRAGESIGDLAAYGGAQVVDWLGAHDYADQVRKNAAEDLTGKLFKKFDKRIDENSVLGEKTDDVISSIGNMYAQGVTSSKLLGSKGNVPLSIGGKKFNLPVTSIISGASSGMGEAVQKNAEDWQVWANGITGGLAEGISESLFGTFGIGGSDLDDAIVNGITKNMKDGLVKTLTKSGIKAVGEGAEEVASYLLNYGSQHLMDYAKNNIGIKGVDLGEQFSNEELWENFFSGTLAAGLGGIPSTINTIRGRSSNINVNEGVDQFTIKNNVPVNNQNQGTEFSKLKIDASTQNDLTKVPTKTNMRYQYEINENPKITNFRKTMADNNFNNSTEAHNFADTIEKIISDKGYNVLFDNTISNINENINAKITTLPNGEVEIKLNPNSNRAGEFLIMHEVTHAIETQEIKDLITDYASKHDDFGKAVQDLMNVYGTNDISSEVVADISGQLFGNQEFINNLSVEKPNIFKRIYNSIVSLANKITGNSNEALFIKDLKNKWETAYRNTTQEQAVNNLRIGSEFSIENNSQGKYVKADRQVIKGNNPLNWEKQVENYINNKIRNNKDVDILTDNGEILTITKDTAGKAKFRNSYIDKNGNKQYMDNNQFYTKLLAEVHIDELAQISKKTNKVPVPDYKNHSFAKNGFDYRSAFFEDNNGDYYKITMSVGKNGTINTIYNVGKLEQRKRPVISGSSVNNNGANGSLSANNIAQSNNNVKSSTKYSMQENVNNTQELDNSSFSLKEKQLDIILNSNPAGNETATWIRNINDIKTFEETLQDSDWADYVDEGFNPDYTGDMIQDALNTGKIMVYSSYPIEQGIFVTPSKMEAESYSGNGKVYSKEVNLNDVAWVDPTQGQYAKVESKYSQNTGKWQEYLDDYYQPSGTRTNMSDIRLPINNISNESLNNNYTNLTQQEQTELNELNDLPFELSEEETNRKTYLENKSKGLIKYADLPTEVTFNDIKNQYSKYKNLNDFNSDVLDQAKSFVPGYRNTEKRTKAEWLEVAKLIGNNINTDSSTELEKYAIQSWHSAKPNIKENLNRQGSKFVKFTIDEWVNTIYKAAGVGETIQNNNVNEAILPVKNSIKVPTKEDSIDNVLPPMNENTRKLMNPSEISQLSRSDADTTPILPPVNRNRVGDGDSRFASNIENKINMLNEEQKQIILDSDEVKYYDKITNKESLDKAFERLNKDGANESLKWFNKDSSKADATDVAEGYILLKQYADSGNYDGMVEVAKKLRDIGTKAGQTVQAFNIMERMTPEGMVKYAQSELQEAYDKMVKNKSQEWINKHREDFDLTPDEVQFIMDNMKEVSTMDDGYDKKVKLAEIQKLMTNKLPPEKGAGIKSWMRISMLFNPKTQVRNVAGNAIIMPVNSFGDLFASYADKIVSKITGVRTTGKTNIKAILKGMKEGAYQATNDYKKGINTKDMSGNRFEITEGKNFNDKTLMGKSLNKVEGMLNYVMDAGDRVFSQAAFENSLQNQLVLNNATEITQDMLDIARTESLQRTWNDNNSYTKFVLDVRRMMNKINIPGAQTYGLGDILIPFAKTPANLTKAIVDYSPVGLVKTVVEGNNLRKSLSNGQFTPQMQHQFVQDLGKATAGTALYVLGYALAKAGTISGESDDDKDVSNFMKNTLGISSYSIKIGNKSFTYDWAQPIAAPLSIMANVVNSKNNQGQALTEAVVGSLDTAGSILLEQSFLQSINDVLSDNDGVVSGLVNEMLELPSRAVPTFSKQIADMVDGTQRTSFEYGKPIESAINSLKAKIPFVSKTLAPTVDTMGREIQKYGGKNNIFNVFLNPANVNTENVSKSAEEIYRLYKETGETNVMPRVAPYYVNKKGEKITLNSNQRAEYQKASGKIIEDGIEQLLNTEEYKNMSDKEKSEVVSDIVNYSYNIAQKEVLGTELSQTYEKAYEYSQIGDIQDYYLFKNSIDNDNKKESISKYLINSDLGDEELAFLYGNYYSTEDKLDALISLNIPIKEYIKLDSADITSDYNSKTGKTITNSKKNKYIQYVNSLKLSVPQKAILIKMQYNSYDSYNSQITNYVKNLKESLNDKKVLMTRIGFDNYRKDVVEYVNSKNKTAKEKEEVLKGLGFTIRDGRVYW